MLRTTVVACLVALCGGLVAAVEPELGELFAEPRIYGIRPQEMAWSPDGERLGFLWNAGGEKALDLYLFEASGRRLVRVTRFAEAEEPARLSAFAWAPDSRRIACTAGGDIYLVEARAESSVTRLTDSDRPESQVAFSPDGRRLSFVRAGNLWSLDVAGGSERRLTSMPAEGWPRSYPDTRPIETYAWSPDGRYLALVTRELDALEEIVIPDYMQDRVAAEPWRRSYAGKPVFESAIGIVAGAGGAVRWLDFADAPFYYSSEINYNTVLAWAPDSSALLVNWTDASYHERRVLVASPRTLAFEEVYRERQQPFLCQIDGQWSPTGDEIFITSEKNGHRHIYAVPRVGGVPRQLTSGDWDVLDLWVPAGGDRLYFEASEHHPLERHAYVMPLAGGEMRRISAQPGTYVLYPSPDGRRLVARFCQYQTPPELVSLDPEGGAPELAITHSTSSAYGALERHEPQYFSFAADDGVVVDGFLVTPHGFDPAKRYPVVLSCVYSDIAKNRFISYDLLDHYMAEAMGYVVVRLDIRGSEGHGRDVHYGHYQKMGVVDAAELVAGARYLRSLPYIDGERIGVWGSSYGGFLTLMTLFNHPGVFSTGVAWKPVTDWLSYTDDYTVPRLGRPQDHSEVYTATSPIHHVQGLADHLLVVHGMRDDNVLFQDTVRLVQALLEAGKDFDVMFYPMADHGLTRRPETFTDLVRRTARFFDTHMGLGPVAGASPVGPAREPSRVRAFDCGGVGTVIVGETAGDDDLPLELAGSSLLLVHQPSASGARYSDGDVVWWSKGEGALLEVARQVYSCVPNGRRTSLERARRDGASLWAAGNEPGWSLRSIGDRLHFTTDYGMRELDAEVLSNARGEAGGRQITARADGRALEVTVEEGGCTDDMSGEPFGVRVEVVVDGVLHRGCGELLVPEEAP